MSDFGYRKRPCLGIYVLDNSLNYKIKPVKVVLLTNKNSLLAFVNSVNFVNFVNFVN